MPDYDAGDDGEHLSELESPAVVILPAAGGGWIGKDWSRWNTFREHLRQFRRRGGIVVVLEAAFNLPAEGQKARGRGWNGFDKGHHAALKGMVEVRANGRSVVSFDAHGYQLQSEWKVGAGTALVTEVAQLAQGRNHVPLAWRWQDRPSRELGCMLFTTCWGWTRRLVHQEVEWVREPFNRKIAEEVFGAFRRMNRALVEAELPRVRAAAKARLERLEHLAGESARLSHRVGREKDYHRLLVNDPELLVDLLGYRLLLHDLGHVGAVPHAASREFVEKFRGAEPVNEPAHDKPGGRRGRLDIQLRAGVGEVEPGIDHLAQRNRSPVAWVELEAGPLHLHQVQEFVRGEKRLHKGDFVCCVDRSDDADADVATARAEVEAKGCTFLHVQVPQAFDLLEEHYAPRLHDLNRRRYTLDIIRGLLG
jgi:hypothetical protein